MSAPTGTTVDTNTQNPNPIPIHTYFEHDLSTSTHALFCGQAGTGKSAYMSTILASIFRQHTPDQVRASWIDTSTKDVPETTDHPHFLVDPVTDVGDAYGLIQFYIWETNRRYARMAEVNVTDLHHYNQWVNNNPVDAENGGHETLPYFVCVIDEYADMVSRDSDVGTGVEWLSRKARAAGVRLMVATQQPSATIISPALKSNLATRVCFRVSKPVISEMVIGESGGEGLSAHGDCLIRDANGIVSRVQGAFNTAAELDELATRARDAYGPADKLDYKTLVADQSLCEWADDYGDDVPVSQRHVRKLS